MSLRWPPQLNEVLNLGCPTFEDIHNFIYALPNRYFK